MPAYTFSFPAAAAGLPVSITNAAGAEVATDTLGQPADVPQGAVILTASLSAGTYTATATDPAIFASFRSPGVIDPASVINVAASAYGVVAAYDGAEPTASTTYYPAWDYLDELGDFLTIDPEDPADNALLISAPGVYQIAISADTPNVPAAPGEFWLQMSFPSGGDPGYAQGIARVIYDDIRGYGSTSRLLVVPPSTTARILVAVAAITDCEIHSLEVQVTKIA